MTDHHLLQPQLPDPIWLPTTLVINPTLADWDHFQKYFVFQIKQQHNTECFLNDLHFKMILTFYDTI